MAISVQYLFLKLKPQFPGLRLIPSRVMNGSMSPEELPPERQPILLRPAELPAERGGKGYALVPDGHTLWAAESIVPGSEEGEFLADGVRIRASECPALLIFADRVPAGKIGVPILLAPPETDHYCLYREIWRIFNENNRWQMDISRELLRGEKPLVLLEQTARLIDGPMYFADPSFMLIASIGAVDSEYTQIFSYQVQHGYLPFEVLMKLIHTEELARINASAHAVYIGRSQCFRLPYIAKVIHRGSKVLGYFVTIQSGRQLTDYELEVADRIGEILADAPDSLIPWLQSESFLYENFLLDIMRGGLDNREHIERQLQGFGWGLEDPYRVMVLSTRNTDELINRNLISIFATPWGAKGFTYKDVLVIVHHRPADYLDQLRRELPEMFKAYRVRGAMSEEFCDFSQIKAYYRQAVRTLLLAGNAGNTSELQFFDDYYLAYRSSVMAEQTPVYSVIDRMQKFDRENRTEYCQTLYEYLLKGNNVITAAKALFIHRNTMNYRMGKIQELFGLDLENPQVRGRCLDSLGAILLPGKSGKEP